ncbi:MAG: hypothetical protein SPL73_08730 [Cyanobacteriota bacterium]|nr:hypothetical protein [Cyanobacteriota bacterium]MDY6359310.1 hypothetical protein [Cyanobacteriota bacterium]MDY6364955.1 hypothetical protein [Cyanobacteriota bacterium]MDY6382891.1 hypothetical protein [Cyanobacteriota bacterium]
MENWVNALDWCAASGVIDYDAPAFILGQNPRYVGHPVPEQIPMHNISLLPPNIKLKDVPDTDTFENSDGKLVHNPLWKKILFGAIAVAGVIGGGIGLSKLKKVKMPKISMPKLNIKNHLTKVWNFIKKPFTFIKTKLAKVFKH